MDAAKEKTLYKRISLFRDVPFADAVVLSGSCAMGSDSLDSDFDVIIICERNRVWTARLFTLLFADLKNIRNKGKGSGKDKLCMSLFLSEEDLSMGIPSNDYERTLFPSVSPIMGSDHAIAAFCLANGISLKAPVPEVDPSFIRIALEKIFRGRFGKSFESFAKKMQESKIERFSSSLPYGVKSRIIISDSRAETHFRID